MNMSFSWRQENATNLVIEMKDPITEETESWDCDWFCQNPTCKSLNSNCSNEPIELWICPFCGWNAIFCMRENPF